MPALPPVPAVLKVRFTYTISTDNVNVNNLHYHFTGPPPDNTSATAWAGVVAAAWATNLAPLCHSSVSLTETRVIDLSTTNGALGVNLGVHAGTRAGTALPAGTCAMSNYTLQRRYRGGKPRTYWPFGVELDILDGQHWKSTTVSSFNSALQAFNTAVVGTPPTGLSGLQQSQVSYYHDFTIKYGPTGRAYNASKLRPEGPVIDSIFFSGVNLRFGSQRRRVRP